MKIPEKNLTSGYASENEKKNYSTAYSNYAQGMTAEGLASSLKPAEVKSTLTDAFKSTYQGGINTLTVPGFQIASQSLMRESRVKEAYDRFSSGQMGYEDMLYEAYGRDLLKQHGYHTDSMAWWMSQIQQGNYQHPMDNGSVMQQILGESEQLLQLESFYKQLTDNTILEKYEKYVGVTLGAKEFEDLYADTLGPLADELGDWEKVVQYYKAGYLGGIVEQLVYSEYQKADDGRLVGVGDPIYYINGRGKLFKIKDKADGKRGAGEIYAVKDGDGSIDRVTLNHTLFGEFATSLGEGFVGFFTSVGDIAGLLYGAAAATATSIVGDESWGEAYADAWAGYKAFMNSSAVTGGSWASTQDFGSRLSLEGDNVVRALGSATGYILAMVASMGISGALTGASKSANVVASTAAKSLNLLMGMNNWTKMVSGGGSKVLANFSSKIVGDLWGKSVARGLGNFMMTTLVTASTYKARSRIDETITPDVVWKNSLIVGSLSGALVTTLSTAADSRGVATRLFGKKIPQDRQLVEVAHRMLAAENMEITDEAVSTKLTELLQAETKSAVLQANSSLVGRSIHKKIMAIQAADTFFDFAQNVYTSGIRNIALTGQTDVRKILFSMDVLSTDMLVQSLFSTVANEYGKQSRAGANTFGYQQYVSDTNLMYQSVMGTLLALRDSFPKGSKHYNNYNLMHASMAQEFKRNMTENPTPASAASGTSLMNAQLKTLDKFFGDINQQRNIAEDDVWALGIPKEHIEMARDNMTNKNAHIKLALNSLSKTGKFDGVLGAVNGTTKFNKFQEHALVAENMFRITAIRRAGLQKDMSSKGVVRFFTGIADGAKNLIAGKAQQTFVESLSKDFLVTSKNLAMDDYFEPVPGFSEAQMTALNAIRHLGIMPRNEVDVIVKDNNASYTSAQKLVDNNYVFRGNVDVMVETNEKVAELINHVKNNFPDGGKLTDEQAWKLIVDPKSVMKEITSLSDDEVKRWVDYSKQVQKEVKQAMSSIHPLMTDADRDILYDHLMGIHGMDKENVDDINDALNEIMLHSTIMSWKEKEKGKAAPDESVRKAEFLEFWNLVKKAKSNSSLVAIGNASDPKILIIQTEDIEYDPVQYVHNDIQIRAFLESFYVLKDKSSNLEAKFIAARLLTNLFNDGAPDVESISPAQFKNGLDGLIENKILTRKDAIDLLAHPEISAIQGFRVFQNEVIKFLDSHPSGDSDLLVQAWKARENVFVVEELIRKNMLLNKDTKRLYEALEHLSGDTVNKMMLSDPALAAFINYDVEKFKQAYDLMNTKEGKPLVNFTQSQVSELLGVLEKNNLEILKASHVTWDNLTKERQAKYNADAEAEGLGREGKELYIEDLTNRGLRSLGFDPSQLDLDISNEDLIAALILRESLDKKDFNQFGYIRNLRVAIKNRLGIPMDQLPVINDKERLAQIMETSSSNPQLKVIADKIRTHDGILNYKDLQEMFRQTYGLSEADKVEIFNSANKPEMVETSIRNIKNGDNIEVDGKLGIVLEVTNDGVVYRLANQTEQVKLEGDSFLRATDNAFINKQKFVVDAYRELRGEFYEAIAKELILTHKAVITDETFKTFIKEIVGDETLVDNYVMQKKTELLLQRLKERYGVPEEGVKLLRDKLAQVDTHELIKQTVIDNLRDKDIPIKTGHFYALKKAIEDTDKLYSKTSVVDNNRRIVTVNIAEIETKTTAQLIKDIVNLGKVKEGTDKLTPKDLRELYNRSGVYQSDIALIAKLKTAYQNNPIIRFDLSKTNDAQELDRFLQLLGHKTGLQALDDSNSNDIKIPGFYRSASGRGIKIDSSKLSGELKGAAGENIIRALTAPIILNMSTGTYKEHIGSYLDALLPNGYGMTEDSILFLSGDPLNIGGYKENLSELDTLIYEHIPLVLAEVAKIGKLGGKSDQTLSELAPAFGIILDKKDGQEFQTYLMLAKAKSILEQYAGDVDKGQTVELDNARKANLEALGWKFGKVAGKKNTYFIDIPGSIKNFEPSNASKITSDDGTIEFTDLFPWDDVPDVKTYKPGTRAADLHDNLREVMEFFKEGPIKYNSDFTDENISITQGTKVSELRKELETKYPNNIVAKYMIFSIDMGLAITKEMNKDLESLFQSYNDGKGATPEQMSGLHNLYMLLQQDKAKNTIGDILSSDISDEAKRKAINEYILKVNERNRVSNTGYDNLDNAANKQAEISPDVDTRRNRLNSAVFQSGAYHVNRYQQFDEISDDQFRMLNDLLDMSILNDLELETVTSVYDPRTRLVSMLSLDNEGNLFIDLDNAASLDLKEAYGVDSDGNPLTLGGWIEDNISEEFGKELQELSGIYDGIFPSRVYDYDVTELQTAHLNPKDQTKNINNYQVTRDAKWAQILGEARSRNQLKNHEKKIQENELGNLNNIKTTNEELLDPFIQNHADFLNDDPAFKWMAKPNKAKITDLRNPIQRVNYVMLLEEVANKLTSGTFEIGGGQKLKLNQEDAITFAKEIVNLSTLNVATDKKRSFILLTLSEDMSEDGSSKIKKQFIDYNSNSPKALDRLHEALIQNKEIEGERTYLITIQDGVTLNKGNDNEILSISELTGYSDETLLENGITTAQEFYRDLNYNALMRAKSRAFERISFSDSQRIRNELEYTRDIADQKRILAPKLIEKYGEKNAAIIERVFDKNLADLNVAAPGMNEAAQTLANVLRDVNRTGILNRNQINREQKKISELIQNGFIANELPEHIHDYLRTQTVDFGNFPRDEEIARYLVYGLKDATTEGVANYLGEQLAYFKMFDDNGNLNTEALTRINNIIKYYTYNGKDADFLNFMFRNSMNVENEDKHTLTKIIQKQNLKDEKDAFVLRDSEGQALTWTDEEGNVHERKIDSRGVNTQSMLYLDTEAIFSSATGDTFHTNRIYQIGLVEVHFDNQTNKQVITKHELVVDMADYARAVNKDNQDYAGLFQFIEQASLKDRNIAIKFWNILGKELPGTNYIKPNMLATELNTIINEFQTKANNKGTIVTYNGNKADLEWLKDPYYNNDGGISGADLVNKIQNEVGHLDFLEVVNQHLFIGNDTGTTEDQKRSQAHMMETFNIQDVGGEGSAHDATYDALVLKALMEEAHNQMVGANVLDYPIVSKINEIFDILGIPKYEEGQKRILLDALSEELTFELPEDIPKETLEFLRDYSKTIDENRRFEMINDIMEQYNVLRSTQEKIRAYAEINNLIKDGVTQEIVNEFIDQITPEGKNKIIDVMEDLLRYYVHNSDVSKHTPRSLYKQFHMDLADAITFAYPRTDAYKYSDSSYDPMTTFGVNSFIYFATDIIRSEEFNADKLVTAKNQYGAYPGINFVPVAKGVSMPQEKIDMFSRISAELNNKTSETSMYRDNALKNFVTDSVQRNFGMKIVGVLNPLLSDNSIILNNEQLQNSLGNELLTMVAVNPEYFGSDNEGALEEYRRKIATSATTRVIKNDFIDGLEEVLGFKKAGARRRTQDNYTGPVSLVKRESFYNMVKSSSTAQIGEVEMNAFTIQKMFGAKSLAEYKRQAGFEEGDSVYVTLHREPTDHFNTHHIFKVVERPDKKIDNLNEYWFGVNRIDLYSKMHGDFDGDHIFIYKPNLNLNRALNIRDSEGRGYHEINNRTYYKVKELLGGLEVAKSHQEKFHLTLELEKAIYDLEDETFESFIYNINRLPKGITKEKYLEEKIQDIYKTIQENKSGLKSLNEVNKRLGEFKKLMASDEEFESEVTKAIKQAFIDIDSAGENIFIYNSRLLRNAFKNKDGQTPLGFGSADEYNNFSILKEANTYAMYNEILTSGDSITGTFQKAKFSDDAVERPSGEIYEAIKLDSMDIQNLKETFLNDQTKFSSEELKEHWTSKLVEIGFDKALVEDRLFDADIKDLKDMDANDFTYRIASIISVDSILNKEDDVYKQATKSFMNEMKRYSNGANPFEVLNEAFKLYSRLVPKKLMDILSYSQNESGLKEHQKQMILRTYVANQINKENATKKNIPYYHLVESEGLRKEAVVIFDSDGSITSETDNLSLNKKHAEKHRVSRAVRIKKGLNQKEEIEKYKNRWPEAKLNTAVSETPDGNEFVYTFTGAMDLNTKINFTNSKLMGKAPVSKYIDNDVLDDLVSKINDHIGTMEDTNWKKIEDSVEVLGVMNASSLKRAKDGALNLVEDDQGNRYEPLEVKLENGRTLTVLRTYTGIAEYETSWHLDSKVRDINVLTLAHDITSVGAMALWGDVFMKTDEEGNLIVDDSQLREINAAIRDKKEQNLSGANSISAYTQLRGLTMLDWIEKNKGSLNLNDKQLQMLEKYTKVFSAHNTNFSGYINTPDFMMNEILGVNSPAIDQFFRSLESSPVLKRLFSLELRLAYHRNYLNYDNTDEIDRELAKKNPLYSKYLGRSKAGHVGTYVAKADKSKQTMVPYETTSPGLDMTTKYKPTTTAFLDMKNFLTFLNGDFMFSDQDIIDFEYLDLINTGKKVPAKYGTDWTPISKDDTVQHKDDFESTTTEIKQGESAETALVADLIKRSMAPQKMRGNPKEKRDYYFKHANAYENLVKRGGRQSELKENLRDKTKPENYLLGSQTFESDEGKGFIGVRDSRLLHYMDIMRKLFSEETVLNAQKEKVTTKYGKQDAKMQFSNSLVKNYIVNTNPTYLRMNPETGEVDLRRRIDGPIEASTLGDVSRELQRRHTPAASFLFKDDHTKKEGPELIAEQSSRARKNVADEEMMNSIREKIKDTVSKAQRYDALTSGEIDSEVSKETRDYFKDLIRGNPENKILKKDMLDSTGVKVDSKESAQFKSFVDQFNRGQRANFDEIFTESMGMIQAIVDTIPGGKEDFDMYTKLRYYMNGIEIAKENKENAEYINLLEQRMGVSQEEANKLMTHFENLNKGLVAEYDKSINSLRGRLATLAETGDFSISENMSEFLLLSPLTSPNQPFEKQHQYTNALNTFWFCRKSDKDIVHAFKASTAYSFSESMYTLARQLGRLEALNAAKHSLIESGAIDNYTLSVGAEKFITNYLSEKTVNPDSFFEKRNVLEIVNEVFDGNLSKIYIGKMDDKMLYETYLYLQDEKKRILSGLNDPSIEAMSLSELQKNADENDTYKEFFDLKVKERRFLLDVVSIDRNLAKGLAEYGRTLARDNNTVLTNQWMQYIPGEGNKRASFNPLYAMDFNSIKRTIKYHDGGNNDDAKLAAAMINGEVYLSNKETADHMDKYFYTYKHESSVEEMLNKAKYMTTNLMMSMPHKMASRMLQFSISDLVKIEMTDASAIMNVPKAMKALSAFYQSGGASFGLNKEDQELQDQLKEYLSLTGLNPKGAPTSKLDLETMTETRYTDFFDGKLAYQKAVRSGLTYQMLTTRFALWKTLVDKQEKGIDVWGPLYHQKEHLADIDPKQRALFVVDATVGGPGGYPLAARKGAAKYFMFLSRPMATLNTSIGHIKSSADAMKEVFAGEANSDTMRYLLTTGLSLVATQLLVSTINKQVAEYYGVDEETEEEWKKKKTYIDPIFSILNGAPVPAFNSAVGLLGELRNMFYQPFEDAENFGEGLVNTFTHNVTSKLNPLFKTPLEIATGKDFFGTKGPIDSKFESKSDNITRKIIQNFIGISGANALLEQWRYSELYDDNPALIDRLGWSMQEAIKAELGNTRAYKAEQKNYFQALTMIRGHLGMEKDPNQTYDYDNAYDYKDATQLSSKIKKALDKKQPPSVIYGYIDEAIKDGISQSSLKSAIYMNSVRYKLSQIQDMNKFYNMIGEKGRTVLADALEYEKQTYSVLDFIANEYAESKYSSRSNKFNSKYIQQSYYKYPPMPKYNNKNRAWSNNYFNNNYYKEYSQRYYNSIKNFVPSLTSTTGRYAKDPTRIFTYINKPNLYNVRLKSKNHWNDWDKPNNRMSKKGR